jgi:MFS superfamily sulfate permease-like transporter
MIGIGAANVTAGLFQGFAVSTSGSRTAVAEQAGAKTQLTGLVGAAVVAAMLVAFPTLLADLPQATLAAVVISAALILADLDALGRFARVRPSSLVLSLVASAGVIFLGVIEGIVLAIALSILAFFRRSWWPHGELLGQYEGQEGWHRLRRHEAATQRPDVVVFRWEAPLFFANAGMFRQQLRHHVNQRRPRWVILQCEAMTDIDVTGADVLEKLDLELNDEGVHILFVELRSRLHEVLDRYGLFGTLDREHFYDTIREALTAIDAEDSPGP